MPELAWEPQGHVGLQGGQEGGQEPVVRRSIQS